MGKIWSGITKIFGLAGSAASGAFSIIGMLPTIVSLVKQAVDGITWVIDKITKSVRKKKFDDAVKVAIESKDTSKIDEVFNGK